MFLVASFWFCAIFTNDDYVFIWVLYFYMFFLFYILYVYYDNDVMWLFPVHIHIHNLSAYNVFLKWLFLRKDLFTFEAWIVLIFFFNKYFSTKSFHILHMTWWLCIYWTLFFIYFLLVFLFCMYSMMMMFSFHCFVF